MQAACSCRWPSLRQALVPPNPSMRQPRLHSLDVSRSSSANSSAGMLKRRHAYSRSRAGRSHTRAEQAPDSERPGTWMQPSSFWPLGLDPITLEQVAIPAAIGLSMLGGGGSTGGSSGGGGGGGDGFGGSGGAPGPQPIASLADARDDDELEATEADIEVLGPEQADEEGAIREDEEADADEYADEEGGVRRRRRARRDAETLGGGLDDDEEAAGYDPEQDSVAASRSRLLGMFHLDRIVTKGLPKGPLVPDAAELLAPLKVQPGKEFSKGDLAADLETLNRLDMFKDIKARVIPGKAGTATIELTFNERQAPAPKSVVAKVWGQEDREPLVPKEVVAKCLEGIEPGPMGLQTESHIKEVVNQWYSQHGYNNHQVGDMSNVGGQVTLLITEPIVHDVVIERLNEGGGNNYPDHWFRRELPFKIGEHLSSEDTRRAMKDVLATNLVDQVQVSTIPKDETWSRIRMEFFVHERPRRTAEVSADWGVAPKQHGDKKLPSLASWVPATEFNYTDRRFWDGQLELSLQNPGLLFPTHKQLDYKADYRKPYVFGSSDHKKTMLVVNLLQSQRASPTFTASEQQAQVQPVLVDRFGVKMGLQESLSVNSKAYKGLVLQNVRTLNGEDQETLVTEGIKQGPTGQADVGPATCLSGNGIDKLMYAQAELVRDNCHYENGQALGARDIFQIDQGLGLGHAKLFNRHIVSLTRFIRLPKQLQLRTKPQIGPLLPGQQRHLAPPSVVVVHGRFANVVGETGSYDLFPLGGPHSVRGFSLAELASARSIAEGSVELRVPIPRINQQAFAFIDHGRELRRNDDVVDNPTDWLQKPGQGTSVGAGLKIGAVNAYGARDLAQGKNSFWVRFGERF